MLLLSITKMGKYVCIKCGLDFKQKSHYEKHLNRKRPCKNIGDKIKDIEENKEQFGNLSKDLTKQLDIKTKKDGGIFFTPFNIIRRSVESIYNYCFTNNIEISNILEPSCGSCEFINYLNSSLENKSIDGIEYNKEIFNSTGEIDFGNKNSVNLFNLDYLKSDDKKYDLIVGNPPYFVMNKKDVDKKYHKYFDGRPNIFVIFILHSLEKLTDNGILSFVLPKSFCNCTYYNKLRIYLYNNYHIIDIIDCSGEKYLETAQDTIIFTIRNEKGDNNQYSFIKNNIILLNTPETIKQIEKLYENTTTINDLGLYVKVGNTVWNQVKDLLTEDDSFTRLIYSGDIIDNKLNLTKYNNEAKKNYINKKGESGPLLIVNRGYGVGGYKFDYCLVNIDKDYTIENHIIAVRSSIEISKEELIKKYNLIIKSFENDKTKEFIKLYCCNSAMNTNELQNILPIYD